jgi:glycosyltransferase involved in cell wall biosynthesis
LELASEIDRLRLVTGTAPKWFDNLRCFGCEHATVNHGRLSPPEVAKVLNQSHCGLALSAEEGAMFAATEYLLCGLPVVTTPARGGRFVWFDEYNHICVEPKAEAVRDAVEQVKAEPRDPHRIRAATLQRMYQFRQRYCDYVNRLAGRAAVTVESLFGTGTQWDDRFIDQQDLPHALASVREGTITDRQWIGLRTQPAATSAARS